MAKFTARHYRAIAEALSATLADTPQSSFADAEITAMIARIADMFARDNPAFNRERFMIACGLNTPDQPSAKRSARHDHR